MGAGKDEARAAAAQKPASVFISYARADHERVEQLALRLERAGHEVWWDRRIGGGAEFSREIETALQAADIVLVAWSRRSVGSHWVRDEAAAGRDSGRLLPVTLDGSPPPLGFRQFQTLDLSGSSGRQGGSEFDEVLEALGSPKASPVAPLETPGGKRGLRVGLGLSLAGALAVGAALYWPTPSEAVAPPQLEIAAVQSLSASVDPQLIPRLRQELRTALATDSAIAVVSPEAAGGSNARFGLTANVDRTSDAVKLAVELADRDSGTTLWSKIIELPASNPELVPRQAAYKVGTVVRCALSKRSKQLKPAALAQWASLCDELWSSQRPGAFDDSGAWHKSEARSKLLAAARKVTEAAPEFSEGWSALAMTAVPVLGQTPPADADALRKEAADAAERALRLDPQNGEAYAAKALLLPQQDYKGREALLKKSISLRPTDCVCQLVFYAQLLMSLGRVEEAYDNFRRVHEMRPLAPMGSNGMAQALFMLGRDQDAREVLSEARALWPDDHELKVMELRSSIWNRDYEAVLALLQDPRFKVPQPRRAPWRVGVQALKSGDAEQRQQAIKALVAASREAGRNNMVVISILAALDAKPEALDAARRFIVEQGTTGAAVLFEPTFAEIRQTPEFAQLVKQLGMSRYWASSRNAPDFCRQTEADFCRTA
ncbi:MAG TPA: TIR domain-containing protein [Allosphingosinicella sp.]|nr:TIR domain-containing protein [Allosphingosinicella sp.]